MWTLPSKLYYNVSQQSICTFTFKAIAIPYSHTRQSLPHLTQNTIHNIEIHQKAQLYCDNVISNKYFNTLFNKHFDCQTVAEKENSWH